MTLSSAMNAAMTGLYAASKTTSVVSDNLANALTPGFSRREMALSTTPGGLPGVHVESITRAKDPAILAGRRSSEAEYSAAEQKAGFYESLSNVVGSVDDPTSLAARQSDLNAALIEAVSRPDSVPRLHELSVKSEALVNSINVAAEEISVQRNNAENSIERQVNQINVALKDIEKLNARITLADVVKHDTVSLKDERDQLIDQINVMIPVQVVPRRNGQVALFAKGGPALLDGRANELTYTHSTDISPYMTLDNGALSGLEIRGLQVDTGPTGAIRGGTLAQEFEIRDVLSMEAQENLDVMARDLIERFQDPAVDGTLGLTDAGLFTDEGAFFDPVNELGIANRLQLNDKVSMEGAGETWRFRDGLNAVTPGNVGDASMLRGYIDALEESRSVTLPGMGVMNVTASSMAGNVLSQFALDQEVSKSSLSFAAAGFTEMSELERSEGVDTDAELQNLLIIEKAYAANAKVISVVDELLETMLRI